MHTLALPKSVSYIELGPQWPLAHYELACLIKKKSLFVCLLPFTEHTMLICAVVLCVIWLSLSVGEPTARENHWTAGHDEQFQTQIPAIRPQWAHSYLRSVLNVVHLQLDDTFANIKAKQVTTKRPERSSSFFGFYYPTSWNSDATLFISNQRLSTPHSDAREAPAVDDRISICIYNTATGGSLEVGSTSLFSFLLGARAQWVGNSSTIIYNFRDADDQFRSCQVQARERSTGTCHRTMQMPIFSLDSLGQLATSINFKRVFCFSSDGSYGYPVKDKRQVLNTEMARKIPDDDGIWVVALSDETASQENRPPVMTPRKLVNWLKGKNETLYTGQPIGEWIEQCYVWFEQPVLNAQGHRLLFLARGKCLEQNAEYSLEEVQNERYFNLGLFTMQVDGGNLWYAKGLPVGHLDFLGPLANQLMLCGNEGVAVLKDGSPQGTLFLSNRTQQSKAHIYA